MKSIITQMPDKYNFYKGRFTIEIGYPWLSYGAIISMEQLLKPTHNVLEFGCGGSTIFFSRRCNSVKSYDCNKEWVEKTRAGLNGSDNVSFVCEEDEERLIESIRQEPDEYYDWLLSDIGFVESPTAHILKGQWKQVFNLRFRIMNEAVPKLKKGMFMVVDQYEQPPLPTFDYTGWDTYKFDIIGHHFKGTLIGVKPK